MLASLACVDYVTPFGTRTPVPLIEQIRPALYVKGGDYRDEDLPEAPVVRGYGGDVRILSLVAGRSTTNIIARVCAAYGARDLKESTAFMPLSVLQVATGFPNWGGTELHILNLSEQLQRRGYDVTVACRPGRWVEERAQQMGLPTVPITRHAPERLAGLRPAARSSCARTRPTSCTSTGADMIVPGFAALREHVPVRIMTRHMPYPFKNRFGSLALQPVLYTRLVTVSDSVRETLLACGVAAGQSRGDPPRHGRRGVRAHDGPRPQRSGANWASPKTAWRSASSGGSPRKRAIEVLLEAAKRLGDRYPLRYVIIGDGPDEAAMTQQRAGRWAWQTGCSSPASATTSTTSSAPWTS